MDYITGVLIGIALSAACGFRIFVPFLVVSIASFTGHFTLSSGFEWIGTYPALIAFSIATLLEIAAYYIPWIDNALDTIASPVAVLAGVVIMASALTDMNPLLKWTLSVVGGGGAAAAVQGFTSITRAASTAVSGGLTNFIIATTEAIASVILSILTIVVPIFAGIVVIIVLCFAVIKLIKWSRKQKGLG
ncbi:MAG: hypothetical protein A2Y62_18905 [Candidatus Fischerbacteria bacterium RBG_13_37_8]|uniref:DUF4126 domain-containing protein n=1 Tax=Candidatus Fischerbacteria bacterium RBG_13_37_8 TaxID=1817863 RepID=A0A1F5VK63_9BACT|nr:MAG: hypothetical protein A2Y62_18905 [Candidatus Fischerbacteria bacterium RBG_13_37_8]